MQWIRIFSRVSVYAAIGAALGWFYGYPLIGLSLAVLLVIVFWCLQMGTLQNWLAESHQPPPDMPGLWGEIVARIYKLQRDAENEGERLQSTIDYLMQSFAAMRDGVVIVEGDNGGIRWSNDAANRLLGLQYPEDLGQAVSNLVRVPAFNEYISAGDYSEPLVFLSAGDNPRYLQLVVTEFAEADRLLYVRDVSDRMRTEQMRRDFVANVSHELRTPLTVITGYLDTFAANDEALPPPFVKPVQQMAQQAARMETLLKDLLLLSRIETHETEEKSDRVDMGALLQELRDEFAGSFPDSKLKLRVETDARVQGDYRDLYSAVGNLIQNAFKYNRDNKAVAVSWRRVGDECRLAVTDQGIGIDPSHIPRLTERFYRVDDSRSSATGGTGLGLAIVKHVAVAHGAHLTVDSRPGQGSTFTLVFPETSEG